jgi:hypothetical protein
MAKAKSVPTQKTKSIALSAIDERGPRITTIGKLVVGVVPARVFLMGIFNVYQWQ